MRSVFRLQTAEVPWESWCFWWVQQHSDQTLLLVFSLSSTFFLTPDHFLANRNVFAHFWVNIAKCFVLSKYFISGRGCMNDLRARIFYCQVHLCGVAFNKFSTVWRSRRFLRSALQKATATISDTVTEISTASSYFCASSLYNLCVFWTRLCAMLFKKSARARRV